MSRSKRSSPQEADRDRQWLGPDTPTRSRPWAYEQLLFGSDGEEDTEEQLSALAADLALDLAELRRMQNELLDQVVRVAGLEGRLEALMRPAEGAAPPERAEEPAREVRLRSFPSNPIPSPASLERPSSLARCEGFRVDSPAGFVGFVEGLRFVSRIDEPDLLEVRGGRFGRHLLLIPIEEVDEISLAEERLVVRSAPHMQDDHVHELAGRLRRILTTVHLPP